MEAGQNESRIGTVGWGIIGAFVLYWDCTKAESLSHAFARGLEHPRAKWACLGALAITSLHLTRNLPDAIDPFDYLAKVPELWSRNTTTES